MTRLGDQVTPALVLRLQTTAGNQAVLRLLHRLAGPPRPVSPPADTAHVGPKPRPAPAAVPEPATDPLPATENQRPPDRAEPAGLAELRRAATAAERRGHPEVARAATDAAHWLRDAAESDPSRRLALAALAVWAEANQPWGRAPWWRRAISWLTWTLTGGRWAGPWLVLSAPAYARLPAWRGKDGAFVAEAADRAANQLLTPPTPPSPTTWADTTKAINGFTPTRGPTPGAVWSDGQRCGVALGGSAGTWVGLTPSFRPGDGWGERSGLSLVTIPSGAKYRQLSAARGDRP